MEISKAAIEGIIRDVIREELGRAGGPPVRQVDPSGVISIDAERVELAPFPFPIPAERVQLADVVSLAESPRLGFGIMAMDGESFDWTLRYDEVDYVISGVLDIIVDGRTVRTEAGQIAYIPKDTAITFSAPGPVRFLYVCYPANWSEQ